MKSIYKSEEGKQKILALYDEQLTRLSCTYKDRYVTTSYGKTHLIETGDDTKKPLLVFHGGNATTAYNLLYCKFLLDKFHIYAVDTIGHPGKSAETCLSPNTYDYGKWASEVITALSYDKIRCFGGSFGGGIIAKLMCVSPEKMERVVLLVPSGIKNAAAIKSASMLGPMILYWLTHKEKWLIQCMMPMAIRKENITDDIYETAKRSIQYAKIKKGMPSNVRPADMRKCFAPTLVMAGEKDCLFPASKVIPQAKKMIPNCTTKCLMNRGHMTDLSKEEEQLIVEFLQESIA
ncbi:alpha/beta fold hydrolase [Anaerosporobacter faecicola]|uniref:alpha/beta fold hydrolase n=1 Tax=Anaerosporobacter faecicola TaxID=2718714 RepID=UPI0014398B48|nr:alpha/beta hydrolase [Anaerosporobacter faecicola]